jgi:hypothetical protein
MSHVTTKWGFIVPDEDDPDDVPSWIDQLADKLDITISGFKADTLANRPVGAGIVDGLLFWDTTNGAFYLGYGGAWHALMTAAGGTPDVSTIGWGDAPAGGMASKGWSPIDHRHGSQANPITAHLAAGDPHSQYSLDTDLTPVSAVANAAQATANENRLQRLMTPGVPCASLRKTDPVFAVAGGVTLLTVPAGRKYVVKSIELVFPAAGIGVTVDVTCAGIYVASGVTRSTEGMINLDMALPLVAGEQVAVSSSAGGLIAVTVGYADLAAAELPSRFYAINGFPGGAQNAYASASNTVISCVTIANVTTPAAPATSRAALRIGAGADWDLNWIDVPQGGIVYIDTPLYVPAATQVMVLDSVGNDLAFTISGYPAQS